MDKQLPILTILETPFYVDWDKRQITQVGDPKNTIPFQSADRPDGRVALLLDKTTKRGFEGTLQESLRDPNVIGIRLRDPAQMDMHTAKFGSDTQKDYDIDNARRVLQRIMAPFQPTAGHRSAMKV